MRRILAASLAALAISLCGQASHAQTGITYTIRTVTPTSVASGSGDTVFVTSGVQTLNQTRYNICFYNGTTSATIVPTAYNFSNTAAVTYTFTVPGARFQTGGAAATPTIYAAAAGTSNPIGCTGTNPGISNTVSSSITAVNYAFRTASPATLPTGSATTSITFTGVFPTFPANTTGLGLCFYAGTNNSPLLPTSQPNTSTATFSLPSADFNVAASAKIYLAPAASTCNGTNPGYGGTLSFAVTQAQNFTITAASPSTLPAGSDDTYIALTGTSNATNTLNDGLCFYTGATSTSISPYNISATEADFIVPSTSFLIPPSAFTSGIFNVKAYLAPINSACTGTNPGISNTVTIPIAYPTFTGASLATLSQANPAVTASPVPNKIDLLGTNFITRTIGRFVVGGTAVILYEQPGSLATSTSTLVTVPRFTGGFTNTSLSVCNYSVSNTYEYCSATTSLPLFPLAATTTQITTSPTAPAPNQATNIRADISSGAASTTAGGTYVPGPPTGTVTFSDGQTNLGAGTLQASSLSLARSSTQQINVTANGGSSSSSNQFNTLVADFNQDGIPDSLIVQPATGVMHLFLGGSPAGTLLPESTITTSAYYCASLPSVAVGDLDGDGYPDIALLCGGSGSNSYLQILYNAGDGTFPNPSVYGINVFGNQLAIGDLDGDGTPELIVAGLTSYSCCSNVTYGIQVYYANDGIYPGQQTATTDNPGTQVAFKDLNNDGFADLAFLHYNATTGKTEVSVYQSNGNGGFTAQTPIPISNGTSTTARLFVAPLTTATQYPDVAVVFPDTQSVITALNQRTATLAFAAPVSRTFTGLKDGVIGDFTADKVGDLAFYDGANVNIALGNGAGQFATGASFTPLAIGTGTTNLLSLAAAPDLNNDGFVELVAIFPTATSTTSTVASYVTTGSAFAAYVGATFTSGTHTLTTTYNGNASVLGSNGSLPLSVGRTAPTITWNPATTTNTTTPLGSNILNATASVPGSFAYTPAAGSFLAAGTQTITAVFTPTDTNTYSAVTTTRNVTVSKTTPVVTTTINPGNHTYTPNLATTYSVIVTGANIVPTGNVQANNNGSPVGSLASLSQSGTVQSSTQILFSSLPAGTFAFTGTYLGDAVYNAVTSTVTNYTVSQATPTVTFAPSPATLVQGAALTAAQLNATSNVPGSFAYSPGLGTVLPAGANTITATFTPTDTLDYQTVVKTATVTVTPKQNPILLFTPNPSSVPYGTPVSSGQLNAVENSNLPGAFTYSSALGAILPVGANIITATFTPTDTANYNTVTKTATITVTQFTPVIVWATPASIPYGTALSATQLNAVANDINGTAIPGTYSYSPAAGTIPSVGTSTDTVTFTPTSTTNFATATATRTITVTPGTTTTSINLNPATVALGQSTTIGISVTPTLGSNMIFGQVTITDNRGTITPAQVSLAYGVASISYTPTTAGVHTINVNYPGNTTYAASSASAPLTVTQGTPVITFAPNPATIPYGTTLSAAQLNAAQTTSIPGAFSYSSPLGTVLPVGANIITATFTPTDTVNYATVTKTATVTVTKFTPVITWAPPASIPFGTALSATQLNAVANDVNGTAIPGTYSYSPASGTIPPVGNTSDTVTFTPTDTINFATATATRSITVTAASTTTTLALNPASITLGQSSTLTATVLPAVGSGPVTGLVLFGDSIPGGPGFYSLNNGVATVQYTPTTAGIHSITVSYQGTGNYNSSSTVAPSILTVTQGNPVIIFAPNPATIPYGTPLSAAQLNAAPTTSIPGAFSYSSPLGTILPVGANTITATFTPTDTTSYSTVTKTATVTVTQFTPAITWAASTISFGTALSSTQLNAVANDISGAAIPGTYTYSPTAGTILTVGANPVTVTFTPTNTTNFATATATRTITVIRTATVTTLSINPTTIGLGQSTTITASVTPTSGAGPVVGQVSFTDSLGTISPAQVTLVNGVATFSYTPTAVGTHVVTVSFPNTTNNSASSAGGNLIVGRGVPVIDFTPNPATIPYGTPLSAAQLNAVQTTSIPGVFSYTSSLGTSIYSVGTILNAGANQIIATFTPTDTTNYSTVTKTAIVTVTQFNPVITWATPASIPFGTPLSSTQLNAIANDINGTAVPGTYSYNPAAGTTLPIGTTQDTLTFTPTNTTNFATTTATRSITVIAAPTTTALSINPGSITLGQATTLTATVAPTLGTAAVTGSVTFTDNRATIPSGPVTLTNGVATLSYTPSANGTHTITATYSGSTNYAASTGVGTLAVGQGLPVITFAPNPSTIVYGTPLSAAQLNAIQTTSIPGAFSYSSPLGTVLPVGANVITATFTPTDITTYATAVKTATITVTPFTPVIAWATPNAIAFGTPLSAIQLNAVARDINGVTVPGTYTYNPAAGTVLPVGTTQDIVSFTPTNTQNFTAATGSVPISVNPGATTTTLAINPGSISLGQSVTLTATVATVLGSAPITGSVVFTDSRETIPSGTVTLVNGIATFVYTPTANGTHAITASFPGNTTYSPSFAVSTIAVGQGLPVITFAPNPATIPYGTPLSAAQLNAVQIGSIPGVFSYSSPLGTVLNAGVNTITATFTPTDTATYATVTKTAGVTVTQLTPTITWAAPPSIVQGTPLSPTQLNATATGLNNAALPGTFTYTPAAGTVLPVGITNLLVLFIPTDLTNYTTATATVPLTVNSANTSLSLAITANNTPAVAVASGTVVTLTATLSTAGTTAYGQVNFCDTTAPTCAGVNIVGSAQLTNAGTATLRLRPGIGGHTYRAVFLGTRTNVASTSAASPLLITGTYPTVTTFTATGATGNFTLTAVVTGTGSPTASPTGTISFLDTSNANAPLATATLGTPTTTQTFLNQTTTSGLTGQIILTADLNNDGIPDIVSSTLLSPASFSVYLGNGDATFTLKSTLGVQGTNVVTGDFNHDNVIDLAILNGKAVSVLLGNGDGTFTLKSAPTLPVNSSSFFVADFNHDGLLDLYSFDGTILLGAGDGTFLPLQNSAAPVAGAIYTDDFDGDGIPDLIAPNGSNSAASYLGKGDGTFVFKSTVTIQGGSTLATSDLNGDGRVDIATVNFFDNSLSVLLGNGDGTFILKTTIPNPVANSDGSNSFNIGLADFNHDGITDLAVTADDGVFIYTGVGDGTFAITSRAVPQTTNPSSGENFGLVIADFNNDGMPDLTTTVGTAIASAPVIALNTFTSTAAATATNVSPIGSGAHQIVASYPGDTNFKSSTSAPINLGGQTFAPTLTWTPAPLTLGTPLGAAQLNAVARNAAGTLIPGVFAYTPATGTILPVGRQPLSVTFTPADRVTYTIATLATTVQVNGLSTATILSSSANPAAFATPINLIAAITPIGGSSTTPITGSVTFLEGTTQLGIAQVANSAATLAISTLGVGNHLITAVYGGDTAGNYLTSTSTTFTQVINNTTPAIAWTPNPATIVYGTRLTSAQLNAVARDATGATLPGAFTYTPAAGSILSAGTQTLSATFTPTDTVRYTATTATAVLTVTRATPTIVWSTPASINQGTPLSAAQLNATANGIDGLALPGTFTYNPAAGSILSAGTQTLNVTFTPADAANYLSNTASVVLNVLNPTTATVLTSSINPSQFGQPTILTATIAIATRGSTVATGNVTFFDGPTQIGTPAPITITSTGATATLTVATLSVGTHQLTAVYANDPNYVTSTSLPLTQTITIAPVTLAWTPTAATIPYGTPLSAAQLNAIPVSPFVPNVSGLLTYTPVAGTILSAGTQTITATFTPTDTTDFLSAAGSTVVTVTQATPALAWSTPAAIAQGTALSATQLNAVASGINGQSLPGTYTYTPSTGTILQTGVTTLRVLFTPADTANYTTATATVPLTVSVPGTVSTIVSSLNPSQSGQSVIFTATVAQTGTGTQPLTGTVTFYDGTTPVVTSPLIAGSATFTTANLSVTTHKVRFIYNGTPDYATSTSNTINQVVTAAATRIAWTPTPASIVYGTPLSAAQLNAVASSGTTTIPGTFTYAPGAGTILTPGTQTLNVTFTPTDTVNFTAATATTAITVTRATPTLAWASPAAITQGTALSATQLNATATGITPNAALPGVFTYTPAAGTILPSGLTTLSVLFTPTDIANYATATTTVPLTVSIPAAKITLTSATNPSQYGQPTTLTATVTPGGTLTAIPTGNVTFSDGTRLLGTSPLNALGAATLPVTTLTAGPHTITATYAGDTANSTVTSTPLAQTVNKAPAILTLAPSPATITYGTALTAAQLNATATSTYIPTVPGAFAYTPALGTILPAGTQTLSITFTPTDAANFSATTQTATLTVTKATPTVTFPTPAPVAVGTILSSAQLAATATGVTNTTLPGTFTYTPAAGTAVTSGPQTLSVLFTPTDTANYTTATATTTLNGTAVTLTALSSTTAFLGDPAKTITLTGTGFVSDSVARSNGIFLATTYVNPTTLTAVLPTTSFRTVQTLQITVNNPTQAQTTSALPFTVSAPAVVIKVNAPTTANPGDQPSITSALAAAYPVDVTGTFNLTFAPISGGVVDPAIQFSTGGNTSAFTIPAGQTSNPNLQIQTGTVAGTITVRLTLTAGGTDVTPIGLAPLVINVPTIAPTITSVTLTRSGRQLTVRTLGFSNTREVTKATFHFVPATGQQIQTPDVTVDVGSIFAGWYSQTASTAYGSTFLYTQTFTLDDDATVVGQVTVTLGNSVGASASGSSQ